MRQKTIVVNIRWEKADIYIGKPSKWGNPFVIGKDGDRAQVLKKYLLYVLSRQDLIDSLSEIKGKRLGCLCKPAECHGDVLVDLIHSPKRTRKRL